MPQSVQRVVEEREREEGLEASFCQEWPSSDGRDHRLCLEMPSERRSGEIYEAEEVERAAEGDGCETVETTAVPGDLRLVDGQVRGDGAEGALFCEDLSCLRLGGVLCCYESAMRC